MKDIGSDAITPSAIYKEVLSLDPVLNKLTVYSTYMACSTGAYKGRVRRLQKLLSVTVMMTRVMIQKVMSDSIIALAS